MPQQAAYDALLLDYAAGTLDPGRALLLQTHWWLTPGAGVCAHAADALGGALLERCGPSRVYGSPALSASVNLAMGSARRISGDEGMVALALSAPETLNWTRLPLGALEVKLAAPGMTLLRLRGGLATPTHDHHGEEWTLVLRGAYEDAFGLHERGDLFHAEAGAVHAPRALYGEDCICLVLRSGRMKFRGVWGVLAAGGEALVALRRR